MGVPVVATNDVRFLERPAGDERPASAILLRRMWSAYEGYASAARMPTMPASLIGVLTTLSGNSSSTARIMSTT
mgnify:CR=1 FL=1